MQCACLCCGRRADDNPDSALKVTPTCAPELIETSFHAARKPLHPSNLLRRFAKPNRPLSQEGMWIANPRRLAPCNIKAYEWLVIQTSKVVSILYVNLDYRNFHL